MLNRRIFLQTTLAATAAGMAVPTTGETLPENSEKSQTSQARIAPRNRRPYANVDWDSAFQIHTTTHGHVTNQKMLDAFLDRGFEFLTLSNYYPSAPYYPMSKMTANYYRVHHEHPVMVKGKLTPGPFDWNEILAPWVNELEEKYRRQYPFKEGDRIFTNYPKDIMEAPNAEHHSFTDSSVHLCAPGSMYASGTFDARDFFQTKSRGGYHYGVGQPWRTGVDNMLNALLFPDGGGVTINHPAWSHLNKDHVLELLDYDPRILGIEVLNSFSGGPENNAWSEDYWDDALGTGRQCFGFFVPDWGVEEGVNILLVPEKTPHECLKAYRQGNWYGAIKGRKILNFRKICFDGKTLFAQTDKPARFQIIAKTGVVLETTATECSLEVSPSDYPQYGFLRIKTFAVDGSGEILFSQPFMLDDGNF